jgi:dTDP-4-dehydrorhamnose 3,5-epimerase
VASEEVLEQIARVAQKDVSSVDADSRELPAEIEGVVLERLRTHADHRGALTPMLDLNRPFWAEPVVYAYEFTIRPGRIKGWGMHEFQADRYVITNGNVRVVLFDGRDDSPSGGRTAQFFFTEATPGTLRIPPGVWHADQNWGETIARLLNFPTRPYNPDSPDKHRIDPHSGAIPFDWRLPDG